MFSVLSPTRNKSEPKNTLACLTTFGLFNFSYVNTVMLLESFNIYLSLTKSSDLITLYTVNISGLYFKLNNLLLLLFIIFLYLEYKADIDTLTFSPTLNISALLRSKFLLACFCIRSDAFKTL